MRKYILYLGCLGLLVGCQSTPSPIKLATNYAPSYDKRSWYHRVNLREAECPILLVDFFDKRFNKSFGQVAYAEVNSNIDERVRLALKQHNINEQNNHSRLSVDIVLKKAYIRSLSTSMAANFVLGAKLDKESEFLYVRGHHVALNWNSSNTELDELINTALSKAIVKLRLSLNKHCVS